MVSSDGSTISSKDIFNETVDYSHRHVYMNNIRREDFRTRTVVWGTGDRGGGGIEDQRTTILRPLGLGSLGSALYL